jgi:hypothetical protein
VISKVATVVMPVAKLPTAQDLLFGEPIHLPDHARNNLPCCGTFGETARDQQKWAPVLREAIKLAQIA